MLHWHNEMMLIRRSTETSSVASVIVFHQEAGNWARHLKWLCSKTEALFPPTDWRTEVKSNKQHYNVWSHEVVRSTSEFQSTLIQLQGKYSGFHGTTFHRRVYTVMCSGSMWLKHEVAAGQPLNPAPCWSSDWIMSTRPTGQQTTMDWSILNSAASWMLTQVNTFKHTQVEQHLDEKKSLEEQQQNTVSSHHC